MGSYRFRNRIDQFENCSIIDLLKITRTLRRAIIFLTPILRIFNITFSMSVLKIPCTNVGYSRKFITYNLSDLEQADERGSRNGFLQDKYSFML